jgi:hypothetical protein
VEVLLKERGTSQFGIRVRVARGEVLLNLVLACLLNECLVAGDSIGRVGLDGSLDDIEPTT